MVDEVTAALWSPSYLPSNGERGSSEALGTFKACMTNMVLGFGCMSRHVSKRAEAETEWWEN